jgi:hypothetical protein
LASNEKISDEKALNDNNENSLVVETGELSTESKCGYAQEGNLYQIEATCVLQGKLPQLSTKDIVDLLRDDIQGFTEIYQPFETTYTYYGSQPLFKTDFNSLLNGSFENNEQLIQLAKQREQI